MRPHLETIKPMLDPENGAAIAWKIVLAAADRAEQLADSEQLVTYSLGDDAELSMVPDGHPDALIAWRPGIGWEALLPAGDPRHALVDLYLPVCSATASRPITVGHLGQSLDGFIAMPDGESQFVTGRENLLHLHRMRALSDAVIVGAGTVAADDPLLTTRDVPGPSPLRVIFDPGRRLGDAYRVFSDDSAATLYACGQSRLQPGESHVGRATILALESGEGTHAMELLSALRERGCSRIFVEGGGVTVSAFLEANLLDRLQMAIAPLIIGDGRPAIRLPPAPALSACRRPRYRVFRMGGDVLFDCDLKTQDASGDALPIEPPISRVI
jgi:diaminohydroxyphosphoribosylaminopyrimidine deaminase / 5-amino-6-(5-phosphoribosylamino)uracil reductase